MRASSILLLALCLLASCQPSKLDPQSYIAYVKNPVEGLVQEREVDNFHFKIQYKPAEFIALNELAGQLSDKEAFEKKISELDGLDYFELSIRMKGGDFIKDLAQSKEDMSLRQYYFSYDFGKDILLQVMDKFQPCALYHFEKNYSVNGESRFLLAFEKSKQKADLVLTLKLDALGLENAEFIFKKRDIEKIPLLII
ncbi:MAG: hypothetical protein ACK4ND_01860 [Cytophagaceae bacterium]